MKIITVLGARPQFIKAAVVSRAIATHNKGASATGIEELIVHTGQHYDDKMSDIFFEEMRIPKPSVNLNINGTTHGKMTGQMLEQVEAVMLSEKPDMVLVYGDTNSTLAGALSARKLNLPVAHVEAGLRSFNMTMPEEINRVLTDHISKWLFCPNINAEKNLKNEGFGRDLWAENNHQIINVGDVMLDAALYYDKICKPSDDIRNLVDNIQKEFSLSTIHRAENTDSESKLRNIFSALDELAFQKPIIMPLHPRTKKCLESYNIAPKNIIIIESVGYFDMLYLLRNCSLVITDSGGLQKEAFFFKKYCITLRDETEWVELVEGGYNKLVGSDKELIKTSSNSINTGNLTYGENFYGNGNAGDLIVKHLYSSFR
jgi:UDP-GlcNAc3NAcA epimerase